MNFSGRSYRFCHYGIQRETGLIDMDQVRAQALHNRPKLIVAGASAYPRILDFAAFRAIADEVGAQLMVDMAHIAGLVAGGAHPSPLPHAQWVTTTTHKTLAGPRGGAVFCRKEDGPRLDKAVFPGLQGGPLELGSPAGRVFPAGFHRRSSRSVQQRTVVNARALPRCCWKAVEAGFGRNRQSPHVGGLQRHRDDRKRAQSFRSHRYHGQ